ncbi:MAG: rod shape-determining protein MreD [Phycisphaerae bacterium]|jgi:rod shape-determining protein MreD|nr:rod shape-determining protein MreD [Phycisphaerae bacterium]
MRWIPFVILIYFAVLIQVALGALPVRFAVTGDIAPDITAVLAVFFALALRDPRDVMMAAWALGLAMDLMLCGMGGVVTAVGPMAVAYAVGAAAVFRVREAFFRERALARALLTLLFCLVVHSMWVTMQTLIGFAWSAWWPAIMKAIGISIYTSAVAPLVCLGLQRCGGWFIATPARRLRRR